MSTKKVAILHIADQNARRIHIKELGSPEPLEWHHDSWGWSIGGVGSGAQIELDEPLEGINLAIWPASNHKFLVGEYLNRNPDSLPTMHAERFGPRHRLFRWGLALGRVLRLSSDRSDTSRTADVTENGRAGKVKVRFDSSALRIGRHVIQFEWLPGPPLPERPRLEARAIHILEGLAWDKDAPLGSDQRTTVENALEWLEVEKFEDITPDHKSKWARAFLAYIIECGENSDSSVGEDMAGEAREALGAAPLEVVLTDDLRRWLRPMLPW